MAEDFSACESFSFTGLYQRDYREAHNGSLPDFHNRHTTPTEPFTGFIDKINFVASTFVMVTFGIGVLILSISPCFFTSLIASIWMFACFRWLNIHGKKMTRNEVIYFEVSNLLEVDPPVFRFGLPEIGDDCLTPGDGEQREAPQPQTLWDALFTDEKKMRMDLFYKKHYGGVHATASKMLMEYELEQAKEKEKEKKDNSTPSSKSTKSF
ncbi:hypothetical protein CAEBREN_21952 [Caenorhabditis brenneri]|uniref:Uncharacterized protein n=1 Tax=Caenorhabditis brenneri TaxID=135651 RepID=G0NWS1_CAEBE|nr:hypothetical protein CAEBREN_21952 [Caenorhabditis brenneri]